MPERRVKPLAKGLHEYEIGNRKRHVQTFNLLGGVRASPLLEALELPQVRAIHSRANNILACARGIIDKGLF